MSTDWIYGENKNRKYSRGQSSAAGTRFDYLLRAPYTITLVLLNYPENTNTFKAAVAYEFSFLLRGPKRRRFCRICNVKTQKG